MANGLTALDMDILASQGCMVPGCTHGDHSTLFLHGRCHIEAPVDVSYELGSKQLLIVCSVCKTTVTKVAIQSL